MGHVLPKHTASISLKDRAIYRRFGHVVGVIVVIAGVVVVYVVMIRGIAVHVTVVWFGRRRQSYVRLKTPPELFGLRVRYDFLRVHQSRRSFSLQTEQNRIKSNNYIREEGLGEKKYNVHRYREKNGKISTRGRIRGEVKQAWPE